LPQSLVPTKLLVKTFINISYSIISMFLLQILQKLNYDIGCSNIEDYITYYTDVT